MNVQQYIALVDKKYRSGIAREHAYRADLQALLLGIVDGIDVTNEPAEITDCGNPDYVITKSKIPIGFIEAKDVGKDLNHKQYREQFERYRKALDNLIITDYLWFQFYRNGKLIYEIRIGELVGDHVELIVKNVSEFESLIQEFCSFVGQTLKSPKKLAKMMAAKARLLQIILERAVLSDERTQENTTLKGQYESFKNVLIHDLSPRDFADIYAQTLAYGMFAARLHDETLDTFSRQEAAELIPKTNPFLRKLFQYVAGYDIDDRIVTTVDNLAEVFRATDVEKLLRNFGSSTRRHDPVIHFYETFLAEYDPKLRKARGVWYTPEPVVGFIVRSVDEVLKGDFGLADGLADTTKTLIRVKTDKPDRRTRSGYVELEKQVHRVQVLDPATGTGTFLSEIVKHIYHQKFTSMKGVWSKYVDEDLIPRLNGFEILMASYSMAHLKLDMLLSETGYVSDKNQRFNIYLTNSLEEYHPDTGTLFSTWLSSEANEANRVKRDTPVMVVLGNPPYSGESANKGDWIMGLMDDYKKEPGGAGRLRERNPKWINDDYVKFLRYGQHFIEKNGEGVLAFITPHGFLDNPTFRGMRWNLLTVYDQIYTIDLHGNSKKKEVSPDGSPDVNVFDIQQGVAITVFVKTGAKLKGDLAEVYYAELYGARESKYKYLECNSISTVEYTKLENIAPMYYWVKKDYTRERAYNTGFSVKDLFLKDSMGVTTGADSTYVRYEQSEFGESTAVSDVHPYSYRPFDDRYINYEATKLARARAGFMENLIDSENYAMCIIRRDRGQILTTPFCVRGIVDKCIVSSLDNANIFPLYLTRTNDLIGDGVLMGSRETNLDSDIVSRIADALGIQITKGSQSRIDAVDIFDYVYAVLHSTTYRMEYGEFLRDDFPRIPYPKTAAAFRLLSKLGSDLRKIHLMEGVSVEGSHVNYPVGGSNVVERKMRKGDWEVVDERGDTGRVWINDNQYFDNIPTRIWQSHIGGYQPAQKWLKDRFQTDLDYGDITHYQRIISALIRSEKIVLQIDRAYLRGFG